MAGMTVSAKELLAAANETARREATQWFFFVTVMLYLTVAVGAVTHRKLFFDEPIPLPVISVAVPLTGFFVVAPAILVVLHFYVLAQARVLREKLAAAVAALRAEGGAAAGGAGERDGTNRAWFQVDPYPVAQAVAGAMLGQGALPLRLMAWLTLIAAPVLLLLFFQVRFLPYQDAATTWWHRVLVVVDLALVWWLWRPVPAERALAVVPLGQFAANAILSVVLSVGAAFFSVVLATVPEEEWEQRQAGVGALARHVASVREWLFDDEPDRTTNRPKTFLSRRLVLLDERLISDMHAEALHKIAMGTLQPVKGQPDFVARTVVLRNRSLRNAVLVATDLRRADLSNADLRGANLDRAWLHGAYLVNARLVGAQLCHTNLFSADISNALLDTAHMFSVDIASSRLLNAKLRGSILVDVNTDGTTDIRDSVWKGSFVRGTELSRAIGFIDLRDVDIRTQAAQNIEEIRPQSFSEIKQQSWLSASSNQKFFGQSNLYEIAKMLRDIACDGNNAPFAARGILKQLEARENTGDPNSYDKCKNRPTRDLGDHRGPLARALLDEAACPGARGLTARERALLREIAEGRR